MTWRVQVLPPSNDTPSNSPLTTSGSVDMATTFDGSVGLMAMASSASLPCIALTSKFGGIGCTAAPAGTVSEPSNAIAASTGMERARIRSIRRFIVASQRWARPPRTEQPYADHDLNGKGTRGVSVPFPACQAAAPRSLNVGVAKGYALRPASAGPGACSRPAIRASLAGILQRPDRRV